jgi:1,4-dihydroxy-6-naphthoate synthase
LSSILQKSIKFAKNNPGPSANYIKENATEMDSSVIEKHIEMFVNDYTLDIGTEGEKAVKALYRKSMEIYPELADRDDLFI